MNCDQKCHCRDNSKCTLDGACETGCATGFRGHTCQECENGFWGTKCEKCECEASQCLKTAGCHKCPSGLYGLKCTNPCHCEKPSECLPLTGHCTGSCSKYFHGDKCALIIPFLRAPPRLISRTADELTVGWTEWKYGCSDCGGKGTPLIYRLTHRQAGSSFWMSRHVNGTHDVLHRLLKSTRYEIGISVGVEEDRGKIVYGVQTPVASLWTCGDPEWSDPQIEAKTKCPSISCSIALSWQLPSESHINCDHISSFKITATDQSLERSQGYSATGENNTATLTDLTCGEQYELSIKIENSAGLTSTSIEKAVTCPSKPTTTTAPTTTTITSTTTTASTSRTTSTKSVTAKKSKRAVPTTTSTSTTTTVPSTQATTTLPSITQKLQPNPRLSATSSKVIAYSSSTTVLENATRMVEFEICSKEATIYKLLFVSTTSILVVITTILLLIIIKLKFSKPPPTSQPASSRASPALTRDLRYTVTTQNPLFYPNRQAFSESTGNDMARQGYLTVASDSVFNSGENNQHPEPVYAAFTNKSKGASEHVYDLLD